MKVELKNTTKKLCVIGDPVLHSKSPVIQNAVIGALGLDRKSTRLNSSH